MITNDDSTPEHTTPWAPPVPEPLPDDRAPSQRRRSGLVAGVTAGLLGGAAVGLVFAMPGSTSAAVDEPAEVAAAVAQVDDTDTGSDETDSGSTSDPGTDEERLAGRTERVRAVLDELVADGTITSEQADAVAAHMAEQAPDRGRHGPRGGLGRLVDGTVLELLDIDVETLRAALQDGATLAEVAESNGVSTDELVGALVEKATERLDEAVADGRLDEAEAAERAAELEERITERVTDPSPRPRSGLDGPGALDGPVD